MRSDLLHTHLALAGTAFNLLFTHYEYRNPEHSAMLAGMSRKWCSTKAWLWAASTVCSRTMHVPFSSAGALAPFGDLHNYQPPPAPHYPEIGQLSAPCEHLTSATASSVLQFSSPAYADLQLGLPTFVLFLLLCSWVCPLSAPFSAPLQWGRGLPYAVHGLIARPCVPTLTALLWLLQMV